MGRHEGHGGGGHGGGFLAIEPVYEESYEVEAYPAYFGGEGPRGGFWSWLFGGFHRHHNPAEQAAIASAMAAAAGPTVAPVEVIGPYPAEPMIDTTFNPYAQVEVERGGFHRTDPHFHGDMGIEFGCEFGADKQIHKHHHHKHTHHSSHHGEIGDDCPDEPNFEGED